MDSGSGVAAVDAGPVGMLVFKEKQLRLLIALSDGSREWYLSGLAKAAGATYVHTSRFVARCEESGLVATERHGRSKRVFLTPKGGGVAEALKETIRRLGQEKAVAQKAAPQQAQQAAQAQPK